MAANQALGVGKYSWYRGDSTQYLAAWLRKFVTKNKRSIKIQWDPAITASPLKVTHQ